MSDRRAGGSDRHTLCKGTYQGVIAVCDKRHKRGNREGPLRLALHLHAGRSHLHVVETRGARHEAADLQLAGLVEFVAENVCRTDVRRERERSHNTMIGDQETRTPLIHLRCRNECVCRDCIS